VVDRVVTGNSQNSRELVRNRFFFDFEIPRTGVPLLTLLFTVSLDLFSADRFEVVHQCAMRRRNSTWLAWLDPIISPIDPVHLPFVVCAMVRATLVQQPSHCGDCAEPSFCRTEQAKRRNMGERTADGSRPRLAGCCCGISFSRFDSFRRLLALFTCSLSFSSRLMGCVWVAVFSLSLLWGRLRGLAVSR
jgi:hypothetical protein